MHGPALSRFQIGPGEGPEVYRPWHFSELISVYNSFVWRYHDLCLFHQVIHRELDRRSEVAGVIAAELTREPPPPADEIAGLMWGRRASSLRAHDIETMSISGYGSQLFVIGLWAIGERALAQTVVATEQLCGMPEQRPPYRWPDLSDRFLALAIDVAHAKNFERADECRVLNNKLKHETLVDNQLAAFPTFAHRHGQELDQVPLPVQLYADAVFEFVGCVLELCDDRVAKGPAQTGRE